MATANSSMQKVSRSTRIIRSAHNRLTYFGTPDGTRMNPLNALELHDNPRVLLTTIMSLIPDDLEEEISLKHDHIDTFQEIMQCCKRRANRMRAKALASLKWRPVDP